MRWLDRAVVWLARARIRPRMEGAPAWDDDDARNLATFLRSPSGQKLGATLRALMVEQAIGATSGESSKLSWRCGHASGVRWVAAYLDTLARWDSEKPGPKDDRPSDNLNWLHGNDDDNASRIG